MSGVADQITRIDVPVDADWSNFRPVTGVGADGRRSIESRLEEIESRTAISDLVAGYCEGLDRYDRARFVGLWHDDAQFLVPGGRGDSEGINQIREVQLAIEKAWARTFHLTTNLVVRFQGPDSATGRSDCLAMSQSRDDGRITYVGAMYDDVFERRDGEWKFARRTVHRRFVTAGVDVQFLP